MKTINKLANWHKVGIAVFSLSLLTLISGLLGGATAAEFTAPTATIEKTPVADTYVASGRPDTAPSAPNLNIFWLGHNQSNGFGIERALLKFTISAQEIPLGSTIQSAKLILTLSGTTKNDGPMNVTVSRILTDQWNENLTWNTHAQLPVDGTNSSTIAVGRDFKQYEWQITNLVKNWAQDSTRTNLSLRLGSDQTSGDHERNFWSKDCKDNECSAVQRPRLVIQFEAPTPTPTPLPTVTPTPTLIPTAIPTPTPGVETLRLITNKSGEIAINEELTYRLDYKTNNFASYELTDVVISDVVPPHTELLTNTITSSGDFIPTYTGSTAGSVITWRSSSSLLPNQSGNVVYTVRRTTATINTVATFDEEDAIYNDGMDMNWLHNSKRESLRSNGVRNPPYYIYLPFLSRQ